jgi:hypothetical protein
MLVQAEALAIYRLLAAAVQKRGMLFVDRGKNATFFRGTCWQEEEERSAGEEEEEEASEE